MDLLVMDNGHRAHTAVLFKRDAPQQRVLHRQFLSDHLHSTIPYSIPACLLYRLLQYTVLLFLPPTYTAPTTYLLPLRSHLTCHAGCLGTFAAFALRWRMGGYAALCTPPPAGAGPAHAILPRALDG